MIKKINYIITFLIIVINLNGQIADIKWSEELSIPNKNDVYQVFSGPDNSIYILRVKDFVNIPSIYFIEKYDKTNYNLIFATEIKLPEFNNKKVKFKEVSVVGKKLYAFSTYFNDNTNYCFASEINPTNGNIVSLLKISEVKSSKNQEPIKFILRNSIDESRLLLYHLDPFDILSYDEMNIQILDENLKVVQNTVITLPYTNKKISISNYTIDIEGNLFILVGIEKDNSNNLVVEYNLISFTFKTKELKEYNINLGNKYPSNITFRHNPNNNTIVVAGVYSEKGVEGVKGVFATEIDKNTKKIIRNAVKEFSPEFIANFMRADNDKDVKSLQNITTDYILFSPDGGLVIAGEQNYISTRCSSSSSSGSTTCVDTYHNKSIFVCKMNKSGAFEWCSAIPKLQVTGRGLYSSYYLTQNGTNIFAVYNDNPDNITNQEIKKIENFKIGPKGSLVLATVDLKGSVTRKEINNETEKSKTVLAPKSTIFIKDGEAILFSCWAKNMRFGKISIK